MCDLSSCDPLALPSLQSVSAQHASVSDTGIQYRGRTADSANVEYSTVPGQNVGNLCSPYLLNVHVLSSFGTQYYVYTTNFLFQPPSLLRFGHVGPNCLKKKHIHFARIELG